MSAFDYSGDDFRLGRAAADFNHHQTRWFPGITSAAESTVESLLLESGIVVFSGTTGAATATKNRRSIWWLGISR